MFSAGPELACEAPYLEILHICVRRGLLEKRIVSPRLVRSTQKCESSRPFEGSLGSTPLSRLSIVSEPELGAGIYRVGRLLIPTSRTLPPDSIPATCRIIAFTASSIQRISFGE